MRILRKLEVKGSSIPNISQDIHLLICWCMKPQSVCGGGEHHPKPFQSFQVQDEIKTEWIEQVHFPPRGAGVERQTVNGGSN